jgi:hypothetical protein
MVCVEMPQKMTTCLIDRAELPSDEQVIAAGREVLEATKGWKKGKAYEKKTVQTYTSPKGPGDGAPWHCRVSEHAPAQVTFDEFWSKLGSSNHSEYEKEYVQLGLGERLFRLMGAGGQVHRGREESDPGQEDFRDARNLDDVLRIPIFRRFSSRVHRFASLALRLEQPPDRVRPSVYTPPQLSHSYTLQQYIRLHPHRLDQRS